MSKKELNLEKLGATSKLKVKKAEPQLDAEKAVQAIHTPKQEKEKIKRLTVELPFQLYVEIKKKLVEEEKTMKDYFVGLASDDIRSKK